MIWVSKTESKMSPSGPYLMGHNFVKLVFLIVTALVSYEVRSGKNTVLRLPAVVVNVKYKVPQLLYFPPFMYICIGFLLNPSCKKESNYQNQI